MARRAAWLWGPLLVAAVVALGYGLWLRSYVASGGDIRSFVHVGQRFLDRSRQTAHPIQLEPGFPVYTDGQSDGYDGEFVFFIARDPLHAYQVVDVPGYRYGRILLPLLARALSFGDPGRIPAALLAINFFWLVVGTGALAAWLVRRGQSPLLALLFGFYPGLFVSLQFDLTEPMSYGLAALGVLLLDVAGCRRRLWAGIVFGLAALTREVAVVFGACFALGLLLEGVGRDGWWPRVRRNLPPALELGLPAVLPITAWLAFTNLALGQWGPSTPPFERVPFLGILHWLSAGVPAGQVSNLELVAVPAAICTAVCLAALWRRALSVEWLVLAANTAVVVMMSRYQWVDYTAAGRAAAGMALAAAVYAPVSRRALGGTAWAWALGAIWFTAMVSSLGIPDLLYIRHLLARV
jgi:hypothetical protein